MRFIFILLSKIILSKDIGSVKCALCGKAIASINAIAEMIDSETYAFDGTDCALMFKKFRSGAANFHDAFNKEFWTRENPRTRHIRHIRLQGDHK